MARNRPARRQKRTPESEVQRTLVSNTDPSNRRAPRPQTFRNFSLKPSRIMLLLVAILAGGLAAYLATQRAPAIPRPIVQPATKMVREASTQILIAKQTVEMGQPLSATSVEWQDWPQSAVRPEYITSTAARIELFAGEPIRREKLAPAGSGYISAILARGMRDTSISVSAEAAAGGFIVPNDHVDVVLTRSSGTGQDAEIILQNIRVLAINARLSKSAAGSTPAAAGDPSADVFSGQAIATLELDPTEAEVIAGATIIGKLSLVLRPSADTVDAPDAGQLQERAINSVIHLSSPFWAAGKGSTVPSPATSPASPPRATPSSIPARYTRRLN